MSTTAAPGPQTTESDTILEELSHLRLLTTQDRCDRCGAQAWVSAKLATTGGQLLFCLHHSREVESALRPRTTHWIDESRFLNAEPASGATD